MLRWNWISTKRKQLASYLVNNGGSMTSNSYAYFSVAYLINWYRETGIPVIADADYQVAHLEDYIE